MQSTFRYSYQSLESYAQMVSRCHFLLRCTPCDTPFQRLRESHISLLSSSTLSSGEDCYGNTIHYGALNEPHDLFVVSSHGIIDSLGSYQIADREPHPIFRVASSLTHPSKALLTLGGEKGAKNGLSRAEELASRIYTYMEYRPNTTSVETTATEAFEARQGVCQDFSHILLSLCREEHIPARYVAGFMAGTGETHAWVEVWSEGVWYGIDPTHNSRVERGYIKISHGRDAADCSVIRGIRRGVTSSQSSVRVIVEEI